MLWVTSSSEKIVLSSTFSGIECLARNALCFRNVRTFSGKEQLRIIGIPGIYQPRRVLSSTADLDLNYSEHKEAIACTRQTLSRNSSVRDFFSWVDFFSTNICIALTPTGSSYGPLPTALAEPSFSR